MNTDSKMTILIVEDDEILAREIKDYLERWGYVTRNVSRFDQVMEEFGRILPQLILMDINLPYYDGFYWCRIIREESQVPIIFISSRDDDRDKIMAITQGGDDYVEKPFHLELLKAKVDAVLRRAYQYKIMDRIRLRQNLYFDECTSSLIYGDRAAELTRTEKRVLTCLLEKRPGIVTREALMTALWDTDEFVSDGTLTTCISRLRSKLQFFCGETLIETKKGQGYYIE